MKIHLNDFIPQLSKDDQRKFQLLDHDLKPFWNFRDELTINNGFIDKGQCTLIPVAIKHDMLEKINASHMGAASNTKMAKEVLFWTHISKDIASMCNSCSECAKFQNTAPKQPMRLLPLPSLSCQIISQIYLNMKIMIILLPSVIFLIRLRLTTFQTH